jgi:hypothetical protein
VQTVCRKLLKKKIDKYQRVCRKVSDRMGQSFKCISGKSGEILWGKLR